MVYHCSNAGLGFFSPIPLCVTFLLGTSEFPSANPDKVLDIRCMQIRERGRMGCHMMSVFHRNEQSFTKGMPHRYFLRHLSYSHSVGKRFHVLLIVYMANCMNGGQNLHRFQYAKLHVVLYHLLVPSRAHENQGKALVDQSKHPSSTGSCCQQRLSQVVLECPPMGHKEHSATRIQQFPGI